MGQHSAHNLESIHERYSRVLAILQEEHCSSMANAFRLARCPHSTIREFVAIAELKIVNAMEHELVTRDHTDSVQQLEQACRKRLRRYLPMMAAIRRKSRLLPLKFDPRIYQKGRHPAGKFKKNGSFRSHQLCKSELTNRSNSSKQMKGFRGRAFRGLGTRRTFLNGG